jgi:hypothetical protein
MLDDYGYRHTLSTLNELARARQIAGYIAEGMTPDEAREYADEIERRR